MKGGKKKMTMWKNQAWFKVSAMVVLFGFAYLATGCASKMMIKTMPEGADVYVDGEHLGESPATYEGKSGLPDKTITVEAKKQGYKDAQKTVKREADIAQVVIGILFFLPAIFWAWYWPDETTLKLEPAEQESVQQEQGNT